MIEPEEYLKTLQISEFKRVYGWDFFPASKNAHPEENTDAGIEKIAEIFNTKINPDELKQYKIDFKNLMIKMAIDLKQDLFDCIHQEYSPVLDRTRLAFVPTGLVNAFCANKTEGNIPLNGYIIGINYGLNFSLFLLGNAIIVEVLQGELAEYRRSGKPFFESAIQMYLNPTIDAYRTRYKLTDLPDNVSGEINAHGAKLSTIMLTFIGLHEFGHIINEYENNNRLPVFNMASGNIKYPIPEDELKNLHRYEFNADEFAIRALCSRSRDSQTAWNNFASIHTFFSWLETLEERLGTPLSIDHPPPKARAERLSQIMEKIAGPPETDHRLWVEEKIREWASN